MTPSKGVRPRWTAEQKQEVADLYARGYSLSDVGRMFGKHPETIKWHLRSQGIQLRPTGMHTKQHKAKVQGPRHHKWNGGRRTNGNGYVEVLVFEDGRRRYVPEHRRVVEEHLLATDPANPALADGKLRTDWVVHHINGIKDDNRLENLEPMPRGKHHSWLHFKDEMARLKALLDTHGIVY